jgi:pimeloyl-ACP methyl ester carboxylesterase
MREMVIESQGRRLHAVEDGDPDGPPVIIHHGTPGAPLLYPPWVRDATARGARLVCFARAGYAGSQRRPGRSVADVAADCAAVADALGIGRFATWGVSGGGPHALACATELGDRVTAVAILGGLAPPDAPDLDFTAGMREDNVAELAAAREGDGALRPLLEPTAVGMASADLPDLLGQLDSFLDPPDAEVASAGFGETLVGGIRVGLRDGVDGWVDDDLALVRPWGIDLSSIACPVGVWHGGLDAMVPQAHGRWLAETLKAERVVLPAREGHLAVLAYRVADVHEWLLDASGKDDGDN